MSDDVFATNAERRDQAGEYWFVLITPGEITGGELDGQAAVQVNAATYSLRERQGRGLDMAEAPTEFADFVDEVSEDMDNVNAAVTAEIVQVMHEGAKPREDVFVDTLVNLMGMPHEVVANMLTGMLMACAENVIQSEWIAADAKENGSRDHND